MSEGQKGQGQKSQGQKFRAAISAAAPKPLQIPGTINAYTALMAERVGHRAIYLSGGGVANASYGLPDLGMTSLNDVLEDVRRITGATDLPLLVDIDTGWGGAFNIAKTIRTCRRRCRGAYRRSGISKALWPSPEQGHRVRARNGGSYQGSCGCKNR